MDEKDWWTVAAIDEDAEVHTVTPTIAKGTEVAEITDINPLADYYLFTVHTVDKLGNVSAGKTSRVYVGNIINATASDVVTKIGEMTQSGSVKVTGAVTWQLLMDIGTTINSLADGIYVKLDLSEVTGVTNLSTVSSEGLDLVKFSV